MLNFDTCSDAAQACITDVKTPIHSSCSSGQELTHSLHMWVASRDMASSPIHWASCAEWFRGWRLQFHTGTRAIERREVQSGILCWVGLVKGFTLGASALHRTRCVRSGSHWVHRNSGITQWACWMCDTGLCHTGFTPEMGVNAACPYPRCEIPNLNNVTSTTTTHLFHSQCVYLFMPCAQRLKCSNALPHT